MLGGIVLFCRYLNKTVIGVKLCGGTRGVLCAADRFEETWFAVESQIELIGTAMTCVGESQMSRVLFWNSGAFALVVENWSLREREIGLQNQDWRRVIILILTFRTHHISSIVGCGGVWRFDAVKCGRTGDCESTLLLH